MKENKKKENQSDRRNIVPELRFPEFENDGGWEEKELGEISEIVRGGSPRPIQDYITNDIEGLNWLKIADVPSDSKYITKTKEKVIIEALGSTREVNPGDLILSNSMSYGRPYILKTTTCIHDGWIAIRKISKITFEDYLYYFISSEFSQSYFQVNAAGAAVKNLNAEIIKLLPIYLSKDKAEQQKIASCLSSLDEVITAHGQKLKVLKDHKKGLMQNLFPQEGITFPKFRFPEFEKDRDWEEIELGELAIKVGSGVTPSGGDANYKKSGRPFVRSQNVGWGIFLINDIAFIDEETHQNSINTEIELDDVLLNITGASIGRSVVANHEVCGGNVNQHVCILRTKRDHLDPFFLCQYLISNLGQKQIDSFQAGGNRQGLNFAQIRSFLIPLPKNLKEQQKIASCLSSLDDLITAQTQKIEQLKTHKKGLMQGLFPVV